jgi:hypothetical protein
MELLMAAHYLEIPDLLETVCRMVADNIDGRSRVVESDSTNFLE